MAKRGRKPGSKNKNKTNNIRKNVQVVGLFVLSILLAVLIYGKTGYIGEHFSPVLSGLIGWMKVCIPIGVFIISISIACDKGSFANTKILELIICIVSIAAILSIYQISERKN